MKKNEEGDDLETEEKGKKRRRKSRGGEKQDV